MMDQSTEIAPGVLFTETISTDRYTGTADALIAAGVVRSEQLPGQPGNGISMTSFYADGRRVAKGTNRACREAGYLKVWKMSRRLLCVDRGVGEAEAHRRRMEWLAAHYRERAEREALARSWPFPIVCGVPQ